MRGRTISLVGVIWCLVFFGVMLVGGKAKAEDTIIIPQRAEGAANYRASHNADGIFLACVSPEQKWVKGDYGQCTSSTVYTPVPTAVPRGTRYVGFTVLPDNRQTGYIWITVYWKK